MSHDEALNYLWEVHDTYFIQHPGARTYTWHALYDYLTIVLPTEDEREDLYAALGIETCVECRARAGLPEEFCPWCEACTMAFERERES